jgi:hypothetical protein
MMTRLAIAGGVLLIGSVFAAELAAAQPAALRPTLTAGTAAGALVEKAQWRYCRYWRHECARRWGWGDYGYRRCLWRHGC